MGIQFNMSEAGYERACPIPGSYWSGNAKDRIHLFDTKIEGIKNKYSIAGEMIKGPPELGFFDKIRGYVLVKDPDKNVYYKLNIESAIKRLGINREEFNEKINNPVELGTLVKEGFNIRIKEDISRSANKIFKFSKELEGFTDEKKAEMISQEMQSVPEYIRENVIWDLNAIEICNSIGRKKRVKDEEMDDKFIEDSLKDITMVTRDQVREAVGQRLMEESEKCRIVNDLGKMVYLRKLAAHYGNPDAQSSLSTMGLW